MRINHNISSVFTQNALFKVNREMSKSLHKLSTGLRINSAADDAAGLGVAENLQTQVRGSSQALKNTQDAISMLKIADGALNEMTNILQRMRVLVIEAKNDTLTQTERNYLGDEYLALFDELDRIAKTTNYNGMQLFARSTDGNNPNGDPKSTILATDAWDDPNNAIFGSNDTGKGRHFNMFIGANYTSKDQSALNSALVTWDPDAANLITIQFGQMDTNALFRTNAGATGSARRDLIGVTGAYNAFEHPGTPYMNNRWGTDIQSKLNTILQLIDGKQPSTGSGVPLGNGNGPTGLERVNKMRAYIGAMINRLEHNVNNLMASETNQQAAESLIRDVDFASETAHFTKTQILSQSATAMLAQANAVPQSVLSLIR